MDKDNSDVFGVAYQCPAGEREANCPLKDFDDLSFKERVEMIKTMSNQVLSISAFDKTPIAELLTEIHSNQNVKEQPTLFD
ncbi:MAG: hypothetical protein JNK09_22860 [Prolixibacteraceae bacterium]|nr:hypothetical protein [Prolixibacteraceae bacterium]